LIGRTTDPDRGGRLTSPGRDDESARPSVTEVAVQPVRASRDRRRSRAAVVAIVALAFGLTGVAFAGRLGEERRTTPDPSAAAAVSVPSNPPSPSPSASPNLRLTGRVLPTIPSRPLAGTPTLNLWRRAGDDLVILEWNPAEPGRPLRPSRRVPRLLEGIPDAQILVGLAPSGQRISLGAFVPRASSTSREIVRVGSLSGHVLWHADVAVPSLVTPTWTPGRDELIVPAPGRWSVVNLADDATERSIRVPTFQREPFGGTLDPVVPQIAAFSGDGRSAYAAAIDSPFGLGLRPLFAVDLDARSAQKLSTLPGDLAETPSLGGSAATGRVDPGTGRVFGLPPPGGSVVRIFAGDGISQKARIERPRVLGATWVRGGNLALLSTNEASPAVDGTRLELIDPNGDATRTLLTTDAVPGGALLPGPAGSLLVALGSPNAVELVVVRLADGATASTIVSSRDLAGAGILDWRPVASP
jgi:hypothetical protein